MYLCNKKDDKIIIYQMTEKWDLIKKFNKKELNSIPDKEKVYCFFPSQDEEYRIKCASVSPDFLKTLTNLYCYHLCNFSLFSLKEPDSDNNLYFAYPTKQDVGEGVYALRITRLLYLLALIEQGNFNLSNYSKEEIKEVLSLFNIQKIVDFSQSEFQRYSNFDFIKTANDWFNQKSEYDKLILKLIKDKK